DHEAGAARLPAQRCCDSALREARLRAGGVSPSPLPPSRRPVRRRDPDGEVPLEMNAAAQAPLSLARRAFLRLAPRHDHGPYEAAAVTHQAASDLIKEHLSG